MRQSAFPRCPFAPAVGVLGRSKQSVVPKPEDLGLAKVLEGLVVRLDRSLEKTLECPLQHGAPERNHAPEVGLVIRKLRRVSKVLVPQVALLAETVQADQQ